MTMYLPNSAVRPSESEPAEFIDFIDLPPMASEGHGETSTSVEPRGRATVQLSPQARIDITRWVHGYITELVAKCSGDSEDVRSIIRELHDQITATDHGRAR
jgi:hypothetical protein